MVIYCIILLLSLITLPNIYSLVSAANQASNDDKFSEEDNSSDIETYRSSARAMRQECFCKDHKCGCCVNISSFVIKTQICVMFGPVHKEPAVLDVSISTTRFPNLWTKRIKNYILESYCKAPTLVPLKICLTFTSYKWTETSVKFCPRLDVKVSFISVPINKFRCFALHEDGVIK